MATEEKKKDDEEKKEEEIKKSSEFRWRVLLSIIVIIGWLIFLILWFVFYVSDYIFYHNIAIILVSILIMVAILGISWASWSMKYCWKGKNDKRWYQLKRIAVGFWIIILLIAFGIVQPLLLCRFSDKPIPEGVIDLSNLLLIMITLFALVLTAFSVLIYQVLHKELTARITKDLKKDIESEGKEVQKHIKEHVNEVKRTEEEVHKHIKEHVNEVSKKIDKVWEIREEDVKNRQNLFRAQMLRSEGFTFWQLFEIWKEVKGKKRTQDIHAKKISEKLIRIAIEKAKGSLHYAKKLPENEYKEDIYRCKSNWVYFLAEAVEVKAKLLTKQDKEDALKLSNEILEKVCKEDYQDYYHYWESCAWALRYLSEKEDEKSKQKTHDIIRELLNDKEIDQIDPSWRGEIEEKWADFLEKKNDSPTSVKDA